MCYLQRGSLHINLEGRCLPKMLFAPAVLVIHPDDADRPLPVLGEFTVEFSRRVPVGSYLLTSEQAVLDGMATVLAMR